MLCIGITVMNGLSVLLENWGLRGHNLTGLIMMTREKAETFKTISCRKKSECCSKKCTGVRRKVYMGITDFLDSFKKKPSGWYRNLCWRRAFLGVYIYYGYGAITESISSHLSLSNLQLLLVPLPVSRSVRGTESRTHSPNRFYGKILRMMDHRHVRRIHRYAVMG